MKKLVWFITSLLIILALVLTACSSKEETTAGTTIVGSTTPGTTIVTTTTVTPTQAITTAIPTEANTVVNILGKTVEKPQYGGTFKFILANSASTDYVDPVISNIGGWVAGVSYDYMMGVDWTKGPSGTGEFANNAAYIPDIYYQGQLVESWEVIDLKTVKFTLRKGVRFQNRPPLNGREVTAYDIQYDHMRAKMDPRNNWYFDHSDAALEAWKKGYTAEVVAAHLADLQSKGLDFKVWRHSYSYPLDKYTWTYRTLNPSADNWRIYSYFPVYAKEAVDAGGGNLNDWRLNITTGPFYMTDLVSQSSITWAKNPDYWQYDPLLPKNKLPYIDTVIGLIIPDQNTALAALRSHKVDGAGVPWNKADDMKKSNPELNWRLTAPSGTYIFFMRTDIAPFNDIRVRQAIMLGVDQQGILKDYFNNNAFLMTWPTMPYHAEYTPYDQLPDDLKPFWGQDITRAKKLLADAGFPNGFKTEMGTYNTDPTHIDIATIAVEQLRQIGVDITFSTYEPAVHDSILYGRKYPGMWYTWWGNADPVSAQNSASGGYPSSISNFSNVVDDEAYAFYKWYGNSTDLAERSKRLKAENLRIMGKWWWIPLPTPGGTSFWAPWLKGYNGEQVTVTGVEGGSTPRFKYFWIDQALRKKMIGQ